MKYLSFAQWPLETYTGQYGDGISVDDHGDDYGDGHVMAETVCAGLEELGFGGDGKVFPIKTWVETHTDSCKVNSHGKECSCPWDNIPDEMKENMYEAETYD